MLVILKSIWYDHSATSPLGKTSHSGRAQSPWKNSDFEMTASNDYQVRILDQEIDAVEICPSFPEYLVIGTYSLVKPSSVVSEEQDLEENGGSPSVTSRVGSLRILPIDADNQNIHDTQCPTELLRVDLPCAVLDVRFSPTDQTLLCASTSIGELRFFRITSVPDETSASPAPNRIVPIGIVKLYESSEDDDGGAPPLITQFAWAGIVPLPTQTCNSERSVMHLLAICDTSGQTGLVQVGIPVIGVAGPLIEESGIDHELRFESYGVHKHLHDLEAWTVSTLTLSNTPHKLRQILLSGGDDSCLIVSTYQLELPATVASKHFHFETLPIRFWLDKRTHGAGVVSILPLPPIQAEHGHNLIPILTGSYDQRLRLLLFDPETFKFTHLTELELEGGVWRIALLDRYHTNSHGDDVVQNDVLLVSAMHAGCYIVRLSRHREADDSPASWEWKIEARFKSPHESMVYACAGNRIAHGDESGGMWRVISTSFYDKRVCTWQWMDDAKMSFRQQNPEMQI